MLSLLGSFYFTARGSVNQVENISELKILLSSGKPVVVQIFSDYWLECLTVKSEVDRLEEDLDGQALVLRLNISDQVGKDFRKEYNLDLVPSFLVFDKYGNESFRKKLRIPEAFEELELIE